jgi:hypothetical protein
MGAPRELPVDKTLTGWKISLPFNDLSDANDLTALNMMSERHSSSDIDASRSVNSCIQDGAASPKTSFPNDSSFSTELTNSGTVEQVARVSLMRRILSA